MGFDHGIVISMEQIAISKFKATCLAVLEQVRLTRRPVRVTRFGEPIAELFPPSPESSRRKGWLGSMVNSGHIVGDIVSPVTKESDWEVLS